MNVSLRAFHLIAWLATLLAMLPLAALDAQEAAPEATLSQPQASQSQADPESTPPAPAPQQPSLEQAYQREFAFLQGQKRDLQQRLQQTRERIEAERSRLQGEIRTLENQVVEMRGRADRLDNLVFESERSVEAARANADLLQATFIQADFTLADAWNNDLGERAAGAEDVSGLFHAAMEFLAAGHAVRRQPGAFFLTDGTRVEGQILRVGNIAAYGISPSGSGALAPAGEGELKLWNLESAEAAQQLAAGRVLETLPMFLFESLNTEVEQRASRNLFEYINQGGVIGWVIFFLGLVGVALVVMRVAFLRSAGASTEAVLTAVSGHVRRGDRDAALEVLKRHKGSTSRVVSATIRNLDRDREHVEDIVSESILHENSHLNRFGSIIIVIAAVSPLLGLLGTVTGMIATFDVITEFGTGDPKLLSGGISIALVTTELGLAVAIPLLLLGNLLSGWAERIKDEMEKAALRVINQYSDGRNAAVAEGAV